MRVEQTPESWGPPGRRTWHRHVATVRSFLSGYRRRGWPARGPGADRRPAHGAPDDSKAIPLPELERLWSRRDLPLRERSLWRLRYDSAAWRQGVRRVAPPGAPPPASHPGSCAGHRQPPGQADEDQIQHPYAYEPAILQPSDHHDGNTPRSTGYAPFWNPIDISPEMRANYLSLQPRKSMVAGVDIGRLHGYSFSRSPERQ